MCQPAHVPVGTIPCTPGRDENLLKPGRDFWGRPTGTITIRQLYSRPGLSSSEQRNPTGFISSRSRPYFPLFPCRSPALPVRHQLDRCAGHTLLDTEIPELALFRILPCVHIKSRSGFFFTGRYYFNLFFFPGRGYKPANSEEKHSKCYLKPAKEPIRLQKKVVLCKSYMFFHLHLFWANSNASIRKSDLQPNARKGNSYRRSTLN